MKQAKLGSFFGGGAKTPSTIKKPVSPTSQDTPMKEDTSKRSHDSDSDEDEGPIRRKRSNTKTFLCDSDDQEDDIEQPIPSITKDASLTDDQPDMDVEIEQATKEEKEQEQETVFEKESAKALTQMSVTNQTEAMGTEWKKGDPVPYATLCRTFEKCEATTKRLEITEYLVTLFIKVIRSSPDSLLEILYMCISKLCPDYEGLELGIGESLLMKAIAKSTGRAMKALKDDYVTIGDLGTVAKNSKSSQRTLFKPKPLTTSHVFKTLKDIAKLSGQSSQNKKVDKIQGLLVACQENEAKYVIRQLEGKLRIGLAEQTVLSALAQASVMVKPEFGKWSQSTKEEELSTATDILKSVHNQLPNYDMIVPALLTYPIDQLLSKCTMRPGIPLKPMLAHPTKSLPEILDRFQDQKFTCEYKYDGERAQIHRTEDGKISIYSRNSEDMSVRYPDIMETISKWIKPTTQSFILDCEAVAWDIEKSCILPFQILSTRKRKDVREDEITVRVAIYGFDCLYLNGKSLLQESLEERRKLLYSAFIETKNQFYFAEHMDSNDIADIQTFLDISIQNNCEGLMVKSYDGTHATYEPSRRSRNWLKVKKDYLNGMGDSMDLVVMGAYYGRGKRTSVYGGFLLGCYDPDTEEFQTICKIGTGFTEEMLKTLYDRLQTHVIPKPKPFFCLGNNGEGTGLTTFPDVWFDPQVIFEVKCADLSISPTYMAGVGQVNDSKGISLRFPRFIRLRDDKEPEQATSSGQVVEFYLAQPNI
ncbi:ATP-dependent DNA ligase [Chlamydoabsidia padenii]|nr:ATP-dependent DNA ligase [Chlamydoabsidia padenii]